MSKRISPAQRLQAEIDEVFAGGEDLAGAIEQVAVLGARLLLQAAIEAEVTAYLGRDRYERTASCEDARAGMRNGYCPTTGTVNLSNPRAIFADSPPRFTRSRVTYEAYVVSMNVHTTSS